MPITVRSLIIGLAGGFFGSMVGLGGAVIIIPLLTGWAKVSQHKAHATSLVAVVFTGIVGAMEYAREGQLNWGIAFPVAIAAVITSILAAAYSSRVPAALLKKIFGGLLVISAIVLIVRPGGDFAGLAGAWQFVGAVVLGLLSGTLTGLLGIGGGAFIVPLLVFVFGLGQHMAQGTSLAVMIPAGIAGTVVHVKNRRIDLQLVIGLVVGVAVGAFLGGQAALGIPERPLQIIFGIILLWTGARYLRTSRPKAPVASES